MIVLDASTALAAVLPDERSGYGRAAASVALLEGAIVPALWPYEIQNGLAMALRRKRIDPTSLSEALEALRSLEPQLRAPRGLGQELRLAQAHGLSAYDAAYLVVALECGAPLATFDLRLQNVANELNVALFAAGD